MALSKEKKDAVVSDLVEYLSSSKVTVMATYTGLSVKESQELRNLARENSTTILVVKNRLVKVAMSKVESLKEVDTSSLEGQLLYAFNNEDEVAPAQLLADFAKKHPAIELKGAFDKAGNLMSEDQVKHLASLPSKEQLRAQLVGTIAAPLGGLVNVLSGNIRGLVNVLNAREQQLQN